MLEHHSSFGSDLVRSCHKGDMALNPELKGKIQVILDRAQESGTVRHMTNLLQILMSHSSFRLELFFLCGIVVRLVSDFSFSLYMKHM